MTSQATGDLATIVARNVRIARRAAGLTQRQLAEKLNTDAALVSKWERAAHRPSDQNVAALAVVTGRPQSWFYADNAEPPASWVGDGELPEAVAA